MKRNDSHCVYECKVCGALSRRRYCGLHRPGRQQSHDERVQKHAGKNWSNPLKGSPR